eukprot:TRINITY_DN11503_c1_g1_i1.p1 TRINITY_DN11503_c1_g1~~TRINITY_DN11503_c1_g1_i1.p1  ORF type:complete len:733 (+),score=123.73 TRINITY_DN11503_c1_g1_i1:153-2351(+)
MASALEDVERQCVAAAARNAERYDGVGEDISKRDGTLLEQAAAGKEFAIFGNAWEEHVFLQLFGVKARMTPERLFRFFVGFYAVFFTVHRLADLAYIITIDARFPHGLEHLYPSEWERQQSIAYMRQVILCRMLHQSAVFAVVCLLVYYGLFAKADQALSSLSFHLSEIWTSYASMSCCLPLWSCLGAIGSCCCSPILKCLSCCCCCSVVRRCATACGCKLSLRQLLHGSVYLTLFALGFAIVSAPFKYRMMLLDFEYGFTNALYVHPSEFWHKFGVQLISAFISGVIGKTAFLFVLQCRFGWLFMWSLMIAAMIFAQFNMTKLAPIMLQMDNAFPSQAFAVGRGFPLVKTSDKNSPWVSLNRIYFQDPASASLQMMTRDKSPGQLVLRLNESSAGSAPHLTIVNRGIGHYSAPYAQSLAAVSHADAKNILSHLEDQSWIAGDKEARIGVRRGKELRDKLFGFAKERNLSIAEIYLVDGSHKDARANAFAAGARDGSIIALYDTLFLGDRPRESEESELEDVVEALQDMTSGTSALQLSSETLEGVDDASEDHLKVWFSAPTQAMSDDEIVGILGHELGHAALWHFERSMLVQASTSFATFAVLGWMAHSPLVLAALAVASPVAVHVGACAYDHLLGPPMEGVVKMFTDWVTRAGEYEADAYVARISERYASALQTSLAKLSVNSNHDPDEPFFYEILHSDHPTFARRWQAIEEVKQRLYPKKSENDNHDGK